MKGSTIGKMMYLIVLLLLLFFAVALYYVASHKLIEKIMFGGG